MNRIFHKSCFFICWQYGNIVWHHVSDRTFTNTQMILFPPHFLVQLGQPSVNPPDLCFKWGGLQPCRQLCL